jgi:hypothetical protein
MDVWQPTTDGCLATRRMDVWQPLADGCLATPGGWMSGNPWQPYVALAERESCELVTSDAKLINNLQLAFLFITSLSALP